MTDQFQVERELKRIIEESLGAGLIFGTRMTSYHDHADEPALSIAVSMKSAKDIPNAARQSELTRRLRDALALLGDPRFPYLYFDALDFDSSPDDVDEFEALPDAPGRI
jgi:hypothetical protein